MLLLRNCSTFFFLKETLEKSGVSFFVLDRAYPDPDLILGK